MFWVNVTGGGKIWECTQDLGDYLSTNGLNKLNGSYVLDLGCGAGILGLLALKAGANVHFQDYVIFIKSTKKKKTNSNFFPQ